MTNEDCINHLNFYGSFKVKKKEEKHCPLISPIVQFGGSHSYQQELEDIKIRLWSSLARY